MLVAKKICNFCNMGFLFHVLKKCSEIKKTPAPCFVKKFWNHSNSFVIYWFSPDIRQRPTEAALRNFETPFLRDEVPLVNAETGRLSAVCQIFLECGNPPTEEKGPTLKIFLKNTGENLAEKGDSS